MLKKPKIRISHSKIISLGFIILILIGSLLLCLPISSASGEFTPFLGSFFTATSASCVTGLVQFDTATHWSFFGQLVILLLIQTGGLGFMTFITFFFMTFRKKVGLNERQIMTESINSSNLGGILSITRTILFGTLFFEGTGAVLLSLRFVPKFGILNGIWMGIFHSVSAFCNAGFDIMGQGNPFSSLTGYYDDVLVNVTVMLLIIIGGLGFLVWDDIFKNGLSFCRYRLQTKVVLFMTALLTFGGAALFFIFEYNNLGAGLTLKGKILTAFFDSVTARTAGFNTTDTAGLSSPSLLLTDILMFIGGNSGSTAGGVKTTSVAVVFAFALSSLKHEQGANFFKRKLDDSALKQAVYVIFLNLFLALSGAVIICAVQNLRLTDVIFETFSAIGTVGMTTGITRELVPVSQLIICLLMYLGRVGSVSFGLALLERRARPKVTFPTEQITVG